VISVGRPLVICLLGFLMAKHRMRAGGGSTWRDIGRLNTELLMPCLSIAAFTKGIDVDALSELWPVLVLAAALPQLWLCIGWLGAKVFLAKDQQQYALFAATAVAYQNGFAIPYPILIGLHREVDFLDDRGEEFSATVCILWSFVILVQIWTIGFVLYGRAAKRERKAAIQEAASPMETSPPKEVATVDDDEPELKPEPGSLASVETVENNDVEVIVSEKPDAEVEQEPARTEIDEKPTASRQVSTTLSRQSSRALASTHKALSNLINPLIASLFVAAAISFSPLREPFVKSVVHDWLNFIGSPSVLLALLQLGAGMQASRSSSASDGLTLRSAALISSLRLVVGNLAGAAVVTLFRRYDLISRHTALAMYIQCSSPTAANLVLVSSVQQAYTQPLSITIFLMQCASVVTMTVSVGSSVLALS